MVLRTELVPCLFNGTQNRICTLLVQWYSEENQYLARLMVLRTESVPCLFNDTQNRIGTLPVQWYSEQNLYLACAMVLRRESVPCLFNGTQNRIGTLPVGSNLYHVVNVFTRKALLSRTCQTQLGVSTHCLVMKWSSVFGEVRRGREMGDWESTHFGGVNNYRPQGKVMVSEACVILSTVGGGRMISLPVWYHVPSTGDVVWCQRCDLRLPWY